MRSSSAVLSCSTLPGFHAQAFTKLQPSEQETTANRSDGFMANSRRELCS